MRGDDWALPKPHRSHDLAENAFQVSELRRRRDENHVEQTFGSADGFGKSTYTAFGLPSAQRFLLGRTDRQRLDVEDIAETCGQGNEQSDREQAEHDDRVECERSAELPSAKST